MTASGKKGRNKRRTIELIISRESSSAYFLRRVNPSLQRFPSFRAVVQRSWFIIALHESVLPRFIYRKRSIVKEHVTRGQILFEFYNCSVVVFYSSVLPSNFLCLQFTKGKNNYLLIKQSKLSESFNRSHILSRVVLNSCLQRFRHSLISLLACRSLDGRMSSPKKS